MASHNEKFEYPDIEGIKWITYTGHKRKWIPLEKKEEINKDDLVEAILNTPNKAIKD